MDNNRYLAGLSGDTCYYEYPFPTGRLYLLGDDRFLKGVLFGTQVDNPLSLKERFLKRQSGSLAGAIAYLDRYLTGEDGEMPALDIEGYTDTERQIYRQLQTIPFGATISYALLGERAGIMHGGRFVGNAMAKNRFPIFIPCHRVLRSDGSIGNYSAGSSVKRFLLEHERAISRFRA